MSESPPEDRQRGPGTAQQTQEIISNEAAASSLCDVRGHLTPVTSWLGSEPVSQCGCRSPRTPGTLPSTLRLCPHVKRMPLRTDGQPVRGRLLSGSRHTWQKPSQEQTPFWVGAQFTPLEVRLPVCLARTCLPALEDMELKPLPAMRHSLLLEKKCPILTFPMACRRQTVLRLITCPPTLTSEPHTWPGPFALNCCAAACSHPRRPRPRESRDTRVLSQEHRVALLCPDPAPT